MKDYKQTCRNCANSCCEMTDNGLDWCRCLRDADWYLAGHSCDRWESDGKRDLRCPHCDEYFRLDIDETPKYCPCCGESVYGEDDVE